MLASYPAASLLLALPFLSSLVVRSVPWLLALATRMNWLTRPIGMLGLACLCAGLLGVFPAPYALPLAILGGLASGYTVFCLPRRGGGRDGGDWWRRGPPPDEPPPPPLAGGPIDWQLFDRLRAQWGATGPSAVSRSPSQRVPVRGGQAAAVARPARLSQPR
jgi:hypothetical protein